MSRRDLLGRGVAAAVIPAIYSIVAPTPIDAQSPLAGVPTLTSISPNQGTPGTTVAVTLTGTGFVVGATTVTVGGGGVTVTAVGGGDVSVIAVTVISTYVADRQLRDRFDRSGWSPHGDGHDRRRDQRRANLHDRSAGAAGRADADQRRAESRPPGQPRCRSR